MFRSHAIRYIALLSLSLPSLLRAQKDFPRVWEGKFTVDASFHSYTPDLAYVIGGDMKEIEVLDGTTGKSLWIYNIRDQQGVKKCENWKTHHENNTVEVITQQGSKEPLVSTFLDYRTGAVVAQGELAVRAKVPAAPRTNAPSNKKRTRTHRVNQTSCLDEATNTRINIGYDAKRILNATKGTDLNITVEASGGHGWKANFTGKVVRHLNNDMLPAEEGDVILDVSTGHGRVFVIYEGITCLDLATGQILWSTTFDNVQTSMGLKLTQEIGRSAAPLIAADGVYICDFTKGERAIKKLDLNTGAVIWQADKLAKNDVVSELLFNSGSLIAHFGGLVRKEEYIPGMNGNPDTYKVSYVFEGSTSIRAYGATDGKPLWNTEEMDLSDGFKKSECTLVNGNGKVLACGEKNLYAFDPANGKVLQQMEYNSKVIGKARWLFDVDDAFMIVGEKGIARTDASLKLTYATNTGKCLLTEMRGDAFIVWTGKKIDDRNEFIRFDPATGAIAGRQKDCPRPCFDTTGDRFLHFDGRKVAQYRTN